MKPATRLLIIGLDGASERLISAGMQAGALPNLARLAGESRWGSLRCTWPPHTASGWTTLFSGRLPGEHGHFQFWDCQDPDYRLRLIGSRQAACPLLWDVLAERGWRLGLVNIPMSHPPGPWPGYQMTWPLRRTIHYCRPPALLREIGDAGGHVLPDVACMYDGSEDYPEKAVGWISDRTRGMRHLLQNRHVEALTVVYTEIDRVSHHYWHGLDPAHPSHHEASESDRRTIARVYGLIDQAVGELTSLVPSDCVILIASDHGFGPARRALSIHRLLEQGGFCRFGNVEAHESYLSRLDWTKTTAFMPTPGCWGINLNLKGRQRTGTVREDQAEDFRSDLTRFLSGQRDPSGQKLFSTVVEGRRAYAGSLSEQAPDLLLVPADPSLILLEDVCEGALWGRPKQSGVHRMDGFWLLRAHPATSGRSPRAMPMESLAGQVLSALEIEDPRIPAEPPEAAEAAMKRAGLPADAWSSKWSVPWPQGQADVLQKEGGARQPAVLSTAQEINRHLKDMGYL